jgi:hypothetical protein
VEKIHQRRCMKIVNKTCGANGAASSSRQNENLKKFLKNLKLFLEKISP